MQYTCYPISQNIKAIRQWNLVLYNMGNIFLWKLCTKCGGESIPRPFSKRTQTWAYHWINNLTFYAVCFYCMLKWQYRTILKLSCWPLAFTSFIAFSKNRKRSKTSLYGSFSAWFFEENYFSCYTWLTDQISSSGCLYFVRYWEICVLQLFVNQAVTS